MLGIYFSFYERRKDGSEEWGETNNYSVTSNFCLLVLNRECVYLQRNLSPIESCRRIYTLSSFTPKGLWRDRTTYNKAFTWRFVLDESESSKLPVWSLEHCSGRCPWVWSIMTARGVPCQHGLRSMVYVIGLQFCVRQRYACRFIIFIFGVGSNVVCSTSKAVLEPRFVGQTTGSSHAFFVP